MCSRTVICNGSPYPKEWGMSGIHEDPCYLQVRNCQSQKPLKYITYHHHPYGCELRETCSVGQWYDDGHIGQCNIGTDTRLKYVDGNKMTNINVPQPLPAFPMNMPQVRGCLTVDLESDLRPRVNDNSTPCLGNEEGSYIPYRFDYFNQLCYDPQETRYIVPEDSFNQAYQAPNYSRPGEDTRHSRQNFIKNDRMFDKTMIRTKVLGPCPN